MSSSTLSRSAYSEAFAHNDAASTGRLLKSRLAAGKELNDRLADFFAERAELEEAYAASLQRALGKLKNGSGKAAAPLQLKGNPALGASSVSAIEKVIERETSQLASLHERFANRCREQLEVPFRSRSSREDWAGLSRLQDRQIDPLLREIEDAASKVSKAQTKGGKKGADKLPSLIQAQSNAENAYRAQLPAYTQQYQQVDYARLNSVKELLTAFETMSNDLGRERMETAERGLEACLLWEVEQELTEFVSKEGFKGTGAGAGRAAPPTSTPGIAINNTDLSNGATADPAPTRPGQGRPRADTAASSSAPSIRSNNTPQKSGGGLLSAFRSGGKLDRRKSTMAPPASSASAAGRDDGTSSGRPSRDRQQSYASSTDDFGRPIQQQDSGRGNSTDSRGTSSKKSNRDSFMPSFSGLGLKRKTGDKGTTQLRETEEEEDADRTFTSSAPDSRQDQGRSLNPFSAVGGQGAGQRPTSQASDATDRPMTRDLLGEAERSPLPSDGLQSPPASAAVDAQGFSVPPADYNKPAWESASGAGAAGGSANLMDMPDSDDERDNMSTGANNNAMRVSIAPAQKAENEAEREAAMLKMKNTLLLQNKPGIANASVNRRNTRGGRSRQSTLGPLATDTAAPALPSGGASPGDDVPIQTILDMHRQQGQRNGNGAPSTIYAGSTPGTDLASPTEMLASPTAPAVPRPPPGVASPGRAGSILSTSSSMQNLSLANGSAARSPLAGKPGFRAAITETVNVLFANGGQVQRVMVTGEIALALRDVSASGIVRLRIGNFGALDKTAPNASVLSSSGSSLGEYSINTSALANANTPATTVFKYTLRIDSHSAGDSKAFVPIEVNPQWKIEPSQTSFLLAYHGNPSSRFSSGEASPFGDSDDVDAPSVLHDVAFSVPVPASVGASNMQTKPEGSYSPEKARIMWKMDDLDISSSRAARLLARYATSGGDQATPQPVSVHWRLPGRLASGITLEAEGIQLDEIVRNTHSGKYMAQP